MKRRRRVPYHGLMNHGSTCYLNSVLQVLFMTKEFREAVNRFVEENPDTQSIDRHLKDLFDDLLKQTTSAHRIIQALSIDRVNERQDAAEYLERILRLSSSSSTQIFHGQMTHRTTCCVCGTESNRDGAFWHLPLDLVNSNSGSNSVEEGIEMFFRASELSGENRMYCDTCDTKVNATSKYVIKHHPDVLILLLKRFDFNHQHSSFIKVKYFVALPSTLKLQETQTYELYAVVDHLGDLRSGHYITIIKSQDDGERWFSFNDTKVSRLERNPFPDNLNSVRSDKAYLLFYRREGKNQQVFSVQQPGAVPEGSLLCCLTEAATGPEEPMEVCTCEDQSAASQILKGDDTQYARRTRFLNRDAKINPIFKSANGVSPAHSKHKLSNALKRLKPSQKKRVEKRQKNETESSDSQQRSRSEGRRNVLLNIKFKKFKQSREDGLTSADAEKEMIHADVKKKRKERSEFDGDDNQEVGAAAGEVREKTPSDQELRRNSSRNKKREKERNRRDESCESDQSKVDDHHEQRRLKSMRESHPDEGPLEQEKHISGSHKTQRKASKRRDRKQKTAGGDSQRRSGSETERLRPNQRAEEEERKLENIQSNSPKVENERKINRELDSAHGTKTSSPRSSDPDESSLSKPQKHVTGKELRKTKRKNRSNQSHGHGLKTYSGVELESAEGTNEQKKKSPKTCFSECFLGGNESD